tara:strand:- start:579 stop:1142 length:564 start_codon:yes stop_codon:yes gene_type:complete
MNNYKRFSINKTIKSLLSSTILVSLLPIFINASKGLEFQWNPNDGYKALKWYQKTSAKNFRNKIFLFFRPSDRKTGLLQINIKFPDKFKSTLKSKNITFCEAKIGGYTKRSKCIKEIPSDIVLDKDMKKLEIYPISPLPSDKNTYAVVFKINNPRKSGLYQFHSFGKSSGPIPVSNYLGSWTITIDP